jgi:hypothetical protein
MRATIITQPSSPIVDVARGTQRVLLMAEITEGKMQGAIVTCSRTTLNSKGETKSIPEVGTEVTLYGDIVPSTEDPTKRTMFFQVQMSTLPEATPMEELFRMLEA